MRLRRPLAALLTALALVGGPATLTACGDPAGTDRSDGTTDTGEDSEGGDDSGLPDNSDPEPDTEDEDDDTQDPD
jgi:hypothetical protein